MTVQEPGQPSAHSEAGANPAVELVTAESERIERTVATADQAWLSEARDKSVRLTVGAALLLVALILSSGLLISVANTLDAGRLRAVLIPLIGILVAVLCVWLLILHVRAVLTGAGRLRTNALLAAFDIAILIGTFAWVHNIEGLIDSSAPNSPVIYDYMASIEFVVLNFTTLGAPHLYPAGHGRSLIAIEGLVGYLVLGLFTVAAVTILSRKSQE